MIDRRRLLKDGDYFWEIITYIVFSISGIYAFLLPITDAEGYMNKILYGIIVGGIFLIPFGYFMGIKRLIRVIIEIHHIYASKIYIIEKTVLDIQIFSSSSKEALLVFGDEPRDNVWISHGKAKQYRVNDVCYQFYLDGVTSNHGKDKPFAIYNSKKFVLDDELKPLLRKMYYN